MTSVISNQTPFADGTTEKQRQGNASPPPYAPSPEPGNPLDEVPQYHTPHYRDGAVAGDDSTRLVAATHIVPPALNGYYKWKFGCFFHLGTSAEDKRFVVRTSMGIRKPLLELLHPHGFVLGRFERGPGDKWLTAEYLNIAIPHADGRPETILRFKLSTREFSLHTSGNKDDGSLPEMFHWRNTGGGEAKELAGNRATCGWKLVRGSPRNQGAVEAMRNYTSSKSKDRTPGLTSDGKEVVAVVCYNESCSWTKLFRFALLGSGLTGTLGYDFEVAAIVTASWFWMGGLDNATVATGA